MYDFMLGGKDSFQVDRDAAAKVLEALPEAVAVVRQNRAFLRRVLRFLAGEAGVRQFLDLGSGQSAMQNVHELPRRSHHGRQRGGSRDAYADSAAGGTTPRPRGQILEFFDGGGRPPWRRRRGTAALPIAWDEALRRLEQAAAGQDPARKISWYDINR